MIVMREVFKRDKPLDNGSGAVSLCVFRSNVNPGECGALTVTPTKDYCRRCAFYKIREDFDRGLGDAARSLRDKGLEPVKKMDYDGRQYMSVRPIEKEDKDEIVETRTRTSPLGPLPCRRLLLGSPRLFSTDPRRS